MIPIKRDEGREEASSGSYIDLVNPPPPLAASSSQTQLHRRRDSAPMIMVNPDADAGISGHTPSSPLLYYYSHQLDCEPSSQSSCPYPNFATQPSPLYCRGRVNSGAAVSVAESSSLLHHGFTASPGQLPSPNQIPSQSFYIQQYPPQMQPAWQPHAAAADALVSAQSHIAGRFQLVRGRSGMPPFIGDPDEATLRLRGAARAEQQLQQQQQLEESCAPKSRWVPTPEQIQVLESLFNSGTTTPSRDQIADITLHVKRFGNVGEANIFYWFQNRKARAKRKQRQAAAASQEESNSCAPDPLFDPRAHSFRRVTSRFSHASKDDNSSSSSSSNFIQQRQFNNTNNEQGASFISSAPAQTHLGGSKSSAQEEDLNIANLMQKGGCMPWSTSCTRSPLANPYTTPDSSSKRMMTEDSSSSIQPLMLRKMVSDPRVSLSLAPPAYLLPLLAATSQTDNLLHHSTTVSSGHPRASDHLSSIVHSNPMRVLDPLTEDLFPKEEQGRTGQVSNNNPQEGLWDDVNPSPSSDWERTKAPNSS